MDDAPNPFAAPGPGWQGGVEQPPAVAVGPEVATLLAAKAGGTERWRLILHERHVRAVPDIGAELVLERDEFLQHASVLPRSADAFLLIRKPQKLLLTLLSDDVQRLVQWVGPDRKRWMTSELRRQARMGTLAGIVLLVLALLDGSWEYMAVAGVTLVHSVLEYTVADRRLFLGYPIAAVLFAGVIAYQVVLGSSLWWSLAFVPLLWFAGISGYRHYQFHA